MNFHYPNTSRQIDTKLSKIELYISFVMKIFSIHSTFLVINKLQAHCIKMNFIQDLCKIFIYKIKYT